MVARKGREMTIDVLRRKADQAWEMAGLARQDRDARDEERYTTEARQYERQIKEIQNERTMQQARLRAV